METNQFFRNNNPRSIGKISYFDVLLESRSASLKLEKGPSDNHSQKIPLDTEQRFYNQLDQKSN